MSASKISSERIGNSFDSWQSVTFFDRPRLIIRWALLLLSTTPELNTRRSGVITGPDPESPISSSKAEEILELGQDALTCISLGNVIHLGQNKLLVS
jgi:hypothetical protein